MADTGSPWNLRYPLNTDLVRDGAEAIKDLAEDVADGLNTLNQLVAVKHVLKTNTFVQSSMASGSNVTVTDMSITHAVANAANRLIISAFFGLAATDLGQGNVGIAIHDGTELIAIGNADGQRTRVSAGGFVSPGAFSNIAGTMPAITFVHTPGAGSKTYTVRVINLSQSSQTLYVNRSELDSDFASVSRAVSSLVIQEVAV